MAVAAPRPAEGEMQDAGGDTARADGAGSSGDGDRKRCLEQAASDDEGAKDGKIQRRDQTMVGELEVNQEADEDENCDECEEYREAVHDDRTGEVLDPRLTEQAEDEEMAYMEQLGVGVVSSEE